MSAAKLDPEQIATLEKLDRAARTRSVIVRGVTVEFVVPLVHEFAVHARRSADVIDQIPLVMACVSAWSGMTVRQLYPVSSDDWTEVALSPVLLERWLRVDIVALSELVGAIVAEHRARQEAETEARGKLSPG